MLLAFDADSREPVGSFIATRSGKIQSCLSGYQVMSYIISRVVHFSTTFKKLSGLLERVSK